MGVCMCQVCGHSSYSLETRDGAITTLTSQIWEPGRKKSEQVFSSRAGGHDLKQIRKQGRRPSLGVFKN